MTIHDLAEYEILDEHRVEDVQSDGFILRHKKVVQGLPFYQIMMIIRYLYRLQDSAGG